MNFSLFLVPRHEGIHGGVDIKLRILLTGTGWRCVDLAAHPRISSPRYPLFRRLDDSPERGWTLRRKKMNPCRCWESTTVFWLSYP